MKNMVNTYLFVVYGSYEIRFIMKQCSRLQNKLYKNKTEKMQAKTTKTVKKDTCNFLTGHH